MNVYATEGTAFSRTRWLVGQSDRRPDEDWIARNTGIDPDSVLAIQAAIEPQRDGGKACWLIFLPKSKKRKPQA